MRGCDWLHRTGIHRDCSTSDGTCTWPASAYINQVSSKYLSPGSSPLPFELTNQRSYSYPSRNSKACIFFFNLTCFFLNWFLAPKISQNPHNQASELLWKSIPSRHRTIPPWYLGMRLHVDPGRHRRSP